MLCLIISLHIHKLFVCLLAFLSLHIQYAFYTDIMYSSTVYYYFVTLLFFCCAIWSHDYQTE